MEKLDVEINYWVDRAGVRKSAVDAKTSGYMLDGEEGYSLEMSPQIPS